MYELWLFKSKEQVRKTEDCFPTGVYFPIPNPSPLPVLKLPVIFP